MRLDDLGFSDFWRIYPRRVGKKAAQLKWKSAIKLIAADKGIEDEAAAEWLLDRTRSFAASDAGKAGIYCPHPTTWLNQGRYDDADEVWDRGSSKPVEEWRP